MSENHHQTQKQGRQRNNQQEKEVEIAARTYQLLKPQAKIIRPSCAALALVLLLVKPVHRWDQ